MVPSRIYRFSYFTLILFDCKRRSLKQAREDWYNKELSFETGQRSIDTYDPYQKGTSELRALDATKRNPLARTAIAGGVLAAVISIMTSCQTVKEIVDDQPFRPTKEMARYIPTFTQESPTCEKRWFTLKGKVVPEVENVSSAHIPGPGTTAKLPRKDAYSFDQSTLQFALETQEFEPNREMTLAIEVLIEMNDRSKRQVKVGDIRTTLFC